MRVGKFRSGDALESGHVEPSRFERVERTRLVEVFEGDGNVLFRDKNLEVEGRG